MCIYVEKKRAKKWKISGNECRNSSAFPPSGKKRLRHSCVIRVSRICYANLSRLFIPPTGQSSRERVAGKRAGKETLPSSPGVMQPGARAARGTLVNEASGDFISLAEIKLHSRRQVLTVSRTKYRQTTNNLLNSILVVAVRTNPLSTFRSLSRVTMGRCAC